MSSTVYRVLLATLFLLASTTAPTELRASPSADQIAANTVKLVRWMGFYQSRLSGIPPADLRDRYDRASTPNGLSHLLKESFVRNISHLPLEDKARLDGFTLEVRKCSDAGPSILIGTDISQKIICVSPLLATSIYLRASGQDVTRMQQQFKVWGLEPSTMNAAYDQKLRRQGITRNDWNAVLGAFKTEWSQLQGSSDMLVAYLIECDVLSKNAAGCGERAARLSAKFNDELDITAFQTSIESAAKKYSSDEWGFRTVGDGVWVARHLIAIKRELMTSP